MPLPLPFVVQDESTQGNFDHIKKEFPLTRRHMKIMTPIIVGSGGTAPAFSGAWVNYDITVYRGLRFWKDPMDMVHIEGAVKSGAVPSTVFVLPVGYRPGAAIPFPAHTNAGHGQVDVAATGNVVVQSGGNTLFGISVHFKQES